MHKYNVVFEIIGTFVVEVDAPNEEVAKYIAEKNIKTPDLKGITIDHIGELLSVEEI